jgi:hypothetical protein
MRHLSTIETRPFNKIAPKQGPYHGENYTTVPDPAL